MLSKAPPDRRDRSGSKTASPLPAWTVIGLTAAVIAIVLIAAISLRSLQSRTDIAGEVSQTHQTIVDLERLLSSLKDIETGERGYLLTGDEQYLAPYQAARSSIPMQLDRLRRTDSRRRDLLEQVDKLVLDRIEIATQTIALMRSGQAEDALAGVRLNRAKPIMDRIREIIAELESMEQALLVKNQEDWETAVTVSVAVVIAGSLLLLGLLTAASMLVSRDHRARERHAWLRAGQMTLSAELQGVARVEAVAERSLGFIAHYLEAQVGSLYVLGSDGRLQRHAGYATAGIDGGDTPIEVGPGEGLVGQVARDGKPLHVTDVPEGYLPVSSSLGKAKARQLLVVPAQADGRVQGVVELGFFHPVHPADLEFLSQISESVAIALRSAKDRLRLEELLGETQQQAEELQTQQEELRVANEELEEQGNALRTSQARLESQQAELEQTNTQLEEQTQLLVRQKRELETTQEELVEKADELLRTNSYKSDFLANMSHELRTPLNSSLILAKLLADNREGNLTEEQVKFASSIHAAGKDLLLLINDILDLSKIEAGKIDLQVQSVTLTHFVDTVTQTFKPVSEQKGVPFAITLERGLPSTFTSDPQRLQQVLNNLLSNAFKFTSKGEVALRVFGPSDGRLAFEVKDSGIGIPPEQHGAIFDAFRQADGTTNRKYGGTGLGLSISRDLARLLGGHIELVSAEGAGSTFTLVIPTAMDAPSQEGVEARLLPRDTTPVPVRSEPQVPVKAPPKVAPLPAFDDDRHQLEGAARTLLVIEDDPAFARILFDLAHELGFRCLVSGEADEGLELALEHRPTAIVLDLGLPDHSGLIVLDRLKRNSTTRHIPVQVITASAHGQTVRAMGAAGYIMKPVPREKIAEALKQLEARFARDVQTVLVVEDDPLQRQSLEALLGSQSVRPVSVATASAALEALGRSTFDCMVLDLSLPDATGYELLERMAQDDAYAFPPVIVYTGRSLSADEEQKLRRYSRSIIIKGAKSPERLLDEVTLFLHQVEANLPADRQRMLKEARDREASFEGRTILIVEDDVRNIFALSRVLEPKGAKLKIARNGIEALAVLDQHPDIDVVLMDIMMPEMDGYEAMRAIRKRPGLDRLPIIALTAKAMRDDHQRSLEAGANDYVAKPIDVEKLLSLIRVWMPT